MNKFFMIIQQDQISEWCWGSCGHGECGALNAGNIVGIPCKHSPCPHLDKEMDEPFCEIDAGPIFLRKLLPLPKKEATHE